MNSENLLIIIPAFNEELRLGNHEYFTKIASQSKVRLCFVNDGSTDNTSQVLRSLAELTGGLSLDLPTNCGKSEAIRQGINYSLKNLEPNYLGFMDCDAAFSEASVSQFLLVAVQLLQDKRNISAVLSSRINLSGRKIHRSTLRHYLSRIIITFIGFVVPSLPYDSQSGLKIFRNSPELRNAMSKPFKTRWFFDIELLIRTNWLASGKVWEEPVLEWRDVAGSHLSLRKAPRLIVEIIRVLRIGRNSRKIS